MIYDYLDQLNRYRGLHANIDLAIDFLDKTDLTQLELGRNEVAGDQVFALVQNNTLNDQPSDSFEYHERYMDLQFLLEGNEHFRYTRSSEGVIQEFDAVNDFGLIRSSTGLDLELNGQTFAMVWPGEYHQPNQLGRGGQSVKKVVVKILID